MTSKNLRAENIAGLRLTYGMPVDQPEELGFICPKDPTHCLQWSEYDTFLWCMDCDKDYPACLCLKDLERATKIYLDSMEHICSKK